MSNNFLCNASKWVEANMPPSYNPATYCTPSPYYMPDLKNLLAGFRDSIDPMMQAQMNLCGVPLVINAASAVTANNVFYWKIQVLEDNTVFNILPGNTTLKDNALNDVNIGAMSAKTYKQGLELFGNWTTIKLTAGHVMLYPHPFLP